MDCSFYDYETCETIDWCSWNISKWDSIFSIDETLACVDKNNNSTILDYSDCDPDAEKPECWSFTAVSAGACNNSKKFGCSKGTATSLYTGADWYTYKRKCSDLGWISDQCYYCAWTSSWNGSSCVSSCKYTEGVTYSTSDGTITLTSCDEQIT